MKTTMRRTIAALGLAAFTVSTKTQELNIATYAGLTVRGEVGKVYSIEYVMGLTQSNDASAWRCLEFLQLPASPYLWVDKSAPAMEKRFYRAVTMAPPTNMVFIPPGTFRMGSPQDEVDRDEWEGPQTDVIISRGFWIGKYEVTQGEYLEVMRSNPSLFQPGDTNRPVETVSWHAANEYCARLTERERLAGRITTNSVYRLPTEAEWEYACRAWTSTRFSYGDDPGYTNLTNYAWTYGGEKATVGQKLHNPWGLHDMHGNALEWCSDWWTNSLPGGIALDPQGPQAGSDRVIRGAHWFAGFIGGKFCRSASRLFHLPSEGSYLLGFRVVLAPGQP